MFLAVAIAVFALVHLRPWYLRLASVFVAIAIAVLGVWKVPAAGIVGVGFFPEDDNAELNIKVETPPGWNLDYDSRRRKPRVWRARIPRCATPIPRLAAVHRGR